VEKQVALIKINIARLLAASKSSGSKSLLQTLKDLYYLENELKEPVFTILNSQVSKLVQVGMISASIVQITKTMVFPGGASTIPIDSPANIHHTY
jgi:hypothetical protein